MASARLDKSQVQPQTSKVRPATRVPADINSTDKLIELQRRVGNRAMTTLLADNSLTQPTGSSKELSRVPLIQRWAPPWAKKKPKISGPTGGHKMTRSEKGGVLSNAELIKRYEQQKRVDAKNVGITNEGVEGVGKMFDDADLEAEREPKRKMALEQGTGKGISDESVEGLSRLFIRLEDVIKRLVDSKSNPLTIEKLKSPCDLASQTERDEVYADKQLMKRVERRLPVRQYISFLGYLRVVEQPKSGVLEEAKGALGGHTNAAKADELIQAKMQAYVTDAVKSGKRVSGQVAVVSDADFRKAYLDEYGPTDLDVDITNAFVRTKGNDGLIVIHAERGNAGTTIHEGMHKYSEPTLQQHVGFHFNEGVTEVLTREITLKLTPPVARGNYQNQFVVVTELVNLVGIDTVKKAYFNGKYNELVSAFVRAGKTREQWNLLIDHFEAKEFQKAYRLL